MTPFTTQTLEKALTAKLMVSFGKTAEEATDGEMMRASALVLRDVMALREVETRQKVRHDHARQVHYLSLEFLMGRSLMKNAYNLGILPQLREALENMGFKAADIFEIEPDAALGNGGLGRLAACYLDSLTTLEIPATGYSICYELGIFKQKIVEGQQVELPDNWKDLGAAWLMPKPAETQEVRFGGTVREFWDNGHLHIVNEDATVVQAVPCDMEIAGYGTEHVNVLRLWDARSTQPVDMSLFSRGEYLKAAEDEAMAETIAKVLYPEDNHLEGKSLRLKQQYFFVSATIQSIAAKHTELYGTMKNFHEKNVIQINDTHPALVIPELMRILIDDAGMDWTRRGRSPPSPWPTPTTPSWRRRWSAGPRTCSSTSCPGSGRSPWRSPAAGRKRWRTSTTIPRKRRRWPSSGAARSAWPTSASPAAWRSTASAASTPRS